MESMLIELQVGAPFEVEAKAVFYTQKAFGMARGAVACSWWAGTALLEV